MQPGCETCLVSCLHARGLFSATFNMYRFYFPPPNVHDGCYASNFTVDSCMEYYFICRRVITRGMSLVAKEVSFNCPADCSRLGRDIFTGKSANVNTVKLSASCIRSTACSGQTEEAVAGDDDDHNNEISTLSDGKEYKKNTEVRDAASSLQRKSRAPICVDQQVDVVPDSSVKLCSLPQMALLVLSAAAQMPPGVPSSPGDFQDGFQQGLGAVASAGMGVATQAQRQGQAQEHAGGA